MKEKTRDYYYSFQNEFKTFDRCFYTYLTVRAISGGFKKLMIYNFFVLFVAAV